MVPRRRFHRSGKSFSLSVGSRRHDRDPGEADRGSAQLDGASWFMGVRDETVCSAVGVRTYIPSRQCRPCSTPCGRSSGRREATTRVCRLCRETSPMGVGNDRRQHAGSRDAHRNCPEPTRVLDQHATTRLASLCLATPRRNSRYPIGPLCDGRANERGNFLP